MTRTKKRSRGAESRGDEERQLRADAQHHPASFLTAAQPAAPRRTRRNAAAAARWRDCGLMAKLAVSRAAPFAPPLRSITRRSYEMHVDSNVASTAISYSERLYLRASSLEASHVQGIRFLCVVTPSRHSLCFVRFGSLPRARALQTSSGCAFTIAALYYTH